MFKHQEIWLPDGERHFPEWMDRNGELVDGKGTYQIKKLRAALGHCRQFRSAIDVGGHVGLWAMQLAKRFQQVHAFEPVPAFRECFMKNAGSMPNVSVHACALGAKPGRVSMTIPPLAGGLDTGGTHVGGDGDVPMYRLDDMVAEGYEKYVHIDFVKIDCEGYEHHVIEGGRQTIQRCRPCIIVEQKPHKLGPNFGIKGTPAVDLLKSWGYQVRREISGDFIMTAD